MFSRKVFSLGPPTPLRKKQSQWILPSNPWIMMSHIFKRDKIITQLLPKHESLKQIIMWWFKLLSRVKLKSHPFPFWYYFPLLLFESSISLAQKNQLRSEDQNIFSDLYFLQLIYIASESKVMNCPETLYRD